ncbi:unnamed protein product [Gongylonema pulchrum]|uniref:Secreted protein n=1 Tax=Gongylonema pulchrum TaxID=637853 RepID=A0A183ESI4_9BILA|nr:unnamed protein product [Gongylonema pulchrum]
MTCWRMLNWAMRLPIHSGTTNCLRSANAGVRNVQNQHRPANSLLGRHVKMLCRKLQYYLDELFEFLTEFSFFC